VVSKYSGIESYTSKLATNWRAWTHEVTDFAAAISPSNSNEHAQRMRCGVANHPLKHLETAATSVKHGACHDVRHDVVITTPRTCVVSFFRGLPVRNRRHRAGSRLAARQVGPDRVAHTALGRGGCGRLARCHHVVSRTLQQHYRTVQSDTIYVPNGATVAPAPPPETDLSGIFLADNYVLFLGRFSPEKNCHLLINAFENLHTDMKLVLAGGSSHSEFLRRESCAATNPTRSFPSWALDDLEELLSNAALFVLPSELGACLALSMPWRRCLRADQRYPEITKCRWRRFTFHRGDQADLERMLALLIRDPELRRQSAVRKRRRIQAIISARIARSIEKAYYNVLGWSPTEHAPSRQIQIGSQP